jgi:hypothetical protein
MGSKINFHYGQETGENYGDDKYYCWNHKKQMIKKYKTEIAIKNNEEAKKTKLLAKEEIKKQKEAEKMKAKEEKQKEKEEKKQKKLNIVADNIVLSTNTDISLNEFCLEILKTGPNKGNKCGCKIYNDNMCKRHSALKLKSAGLVS